MAPPPTAAESPQGEVLPQRLPTLSCPNPFQTTARIRFSLAHPGPVNVTVYDLLGRTVRVLMAGEVRPTGTHEVVFEAHNLSSGTYVYRVESDDDVAAASMILLRGD